MSDLLIELSVQQTYVVIRIFKHCGITRRYYNKCNQSFTCIQNASEYAYH
jgi:hypothetical protein